MPLGAVENLLERSSFVQLLDGSVVELDQNARDVILQSLHEMSSTALRVLGFFAYKEDPSEFATYTGDGDHPAHDLLLDPAKYSSIESKLVFAGLAGLRDPPRKEVRQAIEDRRAAGIQVMVITGDNKNTAEAICREIGVFGPNEDISSKSLTGREFMDHHDQKSHLRQSGGLLFSRAEPRHKQEIVRLLKEDGEVVAMTGDGVNDAPTLKLADIGIAMGIAGTKVAKEASDMVLAYDNFITIVAAVGEGRSIYNNMKAFISYEQFSFLFVNCREFPDEQKGRFNVDLSPLWATQFNDNLFNHKMEYQGLKGSARGKQQIALQGSRERIGKVGRKGKRKKKI